MIKRYHESRSGGSHTRVGYNSIEAQIRNDFINPLFAALGWDISNLRGGQREVLVEYDIHGSLEKVDYCFRINGHPKFFVEAKRPTVALGHDRHVEQIFEYSRKARVPLVVLTNFEELVVYGSCAKPNKRKIAIRDFVPVGSLRYDDYESRWGQLAGMFSRDAAHGGQLDAIVRRIVETNGDVDVFDDAQLRASSPRMPSQPTGVRPQSWPQSLPAAPVVPAPPLAHHAPGQTLPISGLARSGGVLLLAVVGGGVVLVVIVLTAIVVTLGGRSSSADPPPDPVSSPNTPTITRAGRWSTVTNIRPPYTWGVIRQVPNGEALPLHLQPGTRVELLDHGESARSWCMVRAGAVTGYVHHDILDPKCE